MIFTIVTTEAQHDVPTPHSVHLHKEGRGYCHLENWGEALMELNLTEVPRETINLGE